MNKSLVMFGMVFGSMVGGYLPTFFGVNAFSATSVLFSALGGILGIWLTFKLVN